ncbi:MAG: hypothetical protein K2L27_08410 [Muribaculaceae bacterium]|nr:hypothetical protein [Muribaculaceae bacterium]
MLINPKLAKSVTEILPKGIKLELEPQLKAVSNEALAKAVEGKVMKVEIAPLLTNLRKALKDGTKDNPPEVEVGVQAAKLRTIIQNVLNKQGFLLNISTVNDNYSKVVQQKLNGTRYTVKIHADAKEITRSVQASLMQVQSRYFGLKVSRDILYRSIDEALGQKRFTINVAVQHDQARKAVQDALLRAQVIGKDQALAYQRLQTGELKAAQAELARLKAAHMGAADAAKVHATASIDLGGALGSNIKIAGELSSAMASLYSVHAAKEFLSQVIEIGGELEHQKIAMDTIFGDKGKTSELFGQIKGLARQSPFGVMELTKSVKALSAYGVQYNEIYDTAKRLADISAATSVDINRLILAFGKTKSRGFLDGLEAKQFAYANIPIYEMVRRKLEELEGQAVTTAQVMERMKKREIGFDIVKDVLWDMTDEGGKFYNMQEALAGSVKTSWKLVRDNIELMFGEIAESAVGSSLKSLAEILQGLTREWRTVGIVVGTATAGLGVYKIATLGVNSAVQKSTLTTYKNIIAQKQKSAEDLKAWGRITQLNKAELMRIATANKLTNADLRQAIAEGTLTSEHIAQLFWQKKVTAEQIKHLVAIGQLNPAMAKAMLSNNRFTLSLQMMKQGLISAGAAMKAFLLNPWTIGITAITALMGLWQRMGEQSDKAKEFGDALSTKATEGARNLTEALKELNGEFSNLSEIQLSSAVEKLEQTIKDYGINAEKVLFYSHVDESGIERSLEQRAEYLYGQAKVLENAYAKFRDWKMGDMGARAMESTNGNFWTGQWYDGLQADINDYVKDVRNAQTELTKFLREHEDDARLVVRFAADIDPEFAKLTEGMGVEQAMSALTSDIERLQNIYSKIPRESGRLKIDGKDLFAFADLSNQFLNNWANTDVKHSMDEVLREQDTFMAALKKEILSKDKDFFKNLTDEKKVMLGIAFQEAFCGMEGLDDQYVMPFVDRWNKFMGTAFDPQFIEGQIQSQFSSFIPDLGEELAKKVRNGEQLEKAEEDKVKALFGKAVESVKSSWPGKAAEIQNIVDSNPVYANILLAVNMRSGMDKWQQELDDAFGNNREITVKIKGEADTQSTLKAIAELKSATKAALDKFALSFNITPNFGNLEKLSTDGQLTPFEKQQREEFNKLVDTWNDIAKGEKATGIDLDAWGKTKNKDGASKKDTLAESLKQRFKDIKDAWSEFQKWSKTEGREAAATRIGESGLFSTLSADKIPQTVEQYRALVVELENELRQAGVKGTARESLLNDLLKQLLDIDKTVVDEQLKLALDKVSKEAERQLADWNLFDKIRKATGNQDLAMSIAFGMNATAETDYPAMIKQQFNDFAKAAKSALTFDTVTPEALAAAPTEVQKAWEDATKKLQQYAREQKDSIADILNEYQSLQDKLAKIDADRDRKIKTVNESDMSAPDKAKYIQRINVEADYQKFTQSADYLKFFSGIYSLTMEKAQEIGDKIRLHLDQRLQAGKISAEDYYKEIERINQQLSKLRNVKSDALTFLSDGVKGVQQKKLDIADSKVLDQMTKVQEAQEALEKAKASGDTAQIAAAELTLELAETELETRLKIRDAIVKDMEGWQKVLDVANIAANIAGGMSDAFNALRDMADSFGFDIESNAWEAASAVMDTLTTVTSGVQKVIQSAMSGDVGGIIGGVVGVITTPFTIWSKLHDKKLQKMIDRSKEAAQIMQNQYDILEKRMANFLGNAANMKVEGYSGEGGAYGKQLELMKGQLAELEKQRQLEIDKKKTDDSVVEDYNKQIEEMKIAIQDFAVEAANAIYGIDLNGWAQQIGDALVDAFAKGEDAAEAFDKSVADIMRSVVKSIIATEVIAPAMERLRDYLFGDNGVFANYKTGGDFKLSAQDAVGLANELNGVKDEIAAAKDIWDYINDSLGGMLDDTESTKSGLSAGIQSVTEDTADLLASYLNAIRADVAMQTGSYWTRLLDDSLPQMNIIAQSQLDTQRQIAENTLRNAVAAEAIMKSNDDISRLLARVTQGGAKFYVN